LGGDVEALKVTFCDDFEGGFGWIADDSMERCSHGLVVGDRVWLVDPIDAPGVEQRVRAAGTPAGVIQLLDRHRRDCIELAGRLGVAHHVVPEQRIGPFEFLPISMNRRWREVALWWPERRLLTCADALGTGRYFCAGDERLGVHPILRFRPPRQLESVQPEAILCGHGEGIFDAADAALREALSTARRRIPRQIASAAGAWWASRSS
jgi:hypothetical protein